MKRKLSNGAGKTTLMNILFGHYVADEGEVFAFGTPLPPGNPRAALAAGIGMVHQHFTLADNLSALDNIVLGTEPLWSWRSDKVAATARVAQLAEDFGLAIKADARTQAIPVVIVTSSVEDPDVKKAYELGANSYVIKPVQFDAFMEAMIKVGIYWLMVNHPISEPGTGFLLIYAGTFMSNVTRILIVENQLTDYELAQSEIRRVVEKCMFERVEQQKEFLKALDDFQPDLIVSDCSLPRFDGRKLGS